MGQQNLSSQSLRDHAENDLESQLADAVSRQGQVFSGTIALIEQIHSQADLRDPSSQSVIGSLQKSLDEVVSVQHRVTEVHQKLKNSGRPVSVRLQQDLRDQEVTLRNLLTRMDRVKERFEQARDDLIPQLDTDTRRRSMQSAYQKSLKTI